MSDGSTTQEVQRQLDSLRHTGAESVAARDRLPAVACDRLRRLARQMLRHYPAVRAHEQTDDVLNSAVIRLMRPWATNRSWPTWSPPATSCAWPPPRCGAS